MTLSLSLGFVDQTAVNVALPSIQRDFDVSGTDARWTVTAFLLTAAVSVAASGRIADIFGRRRIYLGGTALFGLSSVVCGLAVSDWSLIAARGIQGLAAALMGPAAVAIVVTSFPPQKRGWALGTITAAATVALSLGPLVGGAITETLGWRWIFFLNAPLCVVVIALARAIVIESAGNGSKRLDLRGLFLLAAGLTALVLAISEAPEWGIDAPVTVGLVIAAALSLATLAIVETRVHEPLLDLRALRGRTVVAACTAGFGYQFVMLALNVFLMIYFQTIFGLSPLQAGLLFLPALIPEALLARYVGRVADRTGPAITLTSGLALIALALGLISFLAQGHSYLALVAPLVIFGCGLALVVTPARLAAQTAVSQEHRSLVEGVFATINRLGAALGVAVIGALLVNLQHSQALDLLASRQIRPDADDQAALDSLVVHANAGTRALQNDVPRVVEPVQRAAHDAYVFAFASSMRLAAVIAGLVCVLCFFLMRPDRQLPVASRKLRLPSFARPSSRSG
jgi:EmrB/QacA subfamily drug resistance transporter